jgi:hypothetical protein
MPLHQNRVFEKNVKSLSDSFSNSVGWKHLALWKWIKKSTANKNRYYLIGRKLELYLFLKLKVFHYLILEL